MPAAEKAMANVLYLFYNTVKPTALVNANLPRSGIKGIGLEGTGYAYHASSSQYPTGLAAVRFFYATKDGAKWPSDFSSCGNGARDGQTWRYTWHNSINDDKVWIAVEAFDEALCDSPKKQGTQALVQISIDSERPKVKNRRP